MVKEFMRCACSISASVRGTTACRSSKPTSVAEIALRDSTELIVIVEWSLGRRPSNRSKIGSGRNYYLQARRLLAPHNNDDDSCRALRPAATVRVLEIIVSLT